MQIKHINVPVSMKFSQFAVLAKKAAARKVYLSYSAGVVTVPTKIGFVLANAYAERIAQVDAELAQ